MPDDILHEANVIVDDKGIQRKAAGERSATAGQR
jgi:hypothetical protein